MQESWVLARPAFVSTQPRAHVLWAKFPVEPRVDTQAIGLMMGDDALSGVSTQIKTRQASFVVLLGGGGGVHALSLWRPVRVLANGAADSTSGPRGRPRTKLKATSAGKRQKLPDLPMSNVTVARPSSPLSTIIEVNLNILWRVHPSITIIFKLLL
jgi:hypothetical protein